METEVSSLHYKEDKHNLNEANSFNWKNNLLGDLWHNTIHSDNQVPVSKIGKKPLAYIILKENGLGRGNANLI